MAKERRSKAKKTSEPGIGASVGWRLLVEVIRSLNGSIRTRGITETDELITPVDKAIHITTDDGETIIVDALSNEAMNEMVAQIKKPGDIQRYLEYKEVIWHYKLKHQEHETLSCRAENHYLNAKIALLNDAETDYKDIEQYRDNLEAVLREGRGIEVGLDIVIAEYLNLERWKVFPHETFKNSKILMDFNALLKSVKGAKIKPLSKKQIEPTSAAMERAKALVNSEMLVSEPDEIYKILDYGA